MAEFEMDGRWRSVGARATSVLSKESECRYGSIRPKQPDLEIRSGFTLFHHRFAVLRGIG
jgi:hypothetical protein